MRYERMKPTQRLKVANLLKLQTDDFRKDLTDEAVQEIAKNFEWSEKESRRVATKILKMYL